MRKSSRSISLALIGSALALSGCSSQTEPEWSSGDEVPVGDDRNAQGLATATDQYNPNHSHGSGYHSSPGRVASGVGGAIIGSQIGRALGGGGGSTVAPGRSGPAGAPGGMGSGGATSAPSSRGGFGSSAGHSSASS